jgi:hypothetical protein
MAKFIVQHDTVPEIGIVLEHSDGGPGIAQGWHGRCTECGRRMHRWHLEKAIEDARRHVDSH